MDHAELALAMMCVCVIALCSGFKRKHIVLLAACFIRSCSAPTVHAGHAGLTAPCLPASLTLPG